MKRESMHVKRQSYDLPDSKATENETHPQTRLHDLLREYAFLLGGLGTAPLTTRRRLVLVRGEVF